MRCAFKIIAFNNISRLLDKISPRYLNSATVGTTGQVVEYHHATVETRVRFPGRHIRTNGLPGFVPGRVTIGLELEMIG